MHVHMYMYIFRMGAVACRFVRGICDKMDGACLLSHKVDKSKVSNCHHSSSFVPGGAPPIWMLRDRCPD